MTKAFPIRIADLAQEMASSIDRRPAIWLAAFSVIYFACAGWLALIRPMWHDEFFTLYISNAPDAKGVFQALMTGADQHPPTFYLLTRLTFPLLGADQFSIRLPELLGYWLMSVCVFAIVSRRTSPAFGFAAMLFPLVTVAYDYAFEARGYALMMGFTALAFLCWQTAVDGGRRSLALVGLALSSAAAVASHYYAVYALFALGVGELARSVEGKRLDAAVWVGLSGALIPLVGFLPFIRSATEWSAHFWTRPTWSAIPAFYAWLFGPSALAGVVLAALYVLQALASAAAPVSRGAVVRRVPPSELIASLVLLGTPIVAVVGAKLAAGGFAPRYALPSVIAASVLLSAGLWRSAQRSTVSTGLVILALAGAFAARQVSECRIVDATRTYLGNTSGWLRMTGDAALPIVAWHADEFLRLRYYAHPGIRSRLAYLADPQASLRVLGNDTGDRGLLALRPWFGPGIQEYRAFLDGHPKFLAFGSTGDYARAGRNWNWLAAELVADGAEMRLVGVAGDDMLYLVTVNAPGSASTRDASP